MAIEASAASSRTRSLLLLGAALVIGFAMAFWFARRIQQTVKQILDRIQTLREHDTTDLRNALDAVATGDLTIDVTPVTPPLSRTSNDEIGDVAEAVGSIRDNTSPPSRPTTPCGRSWRPPSPSSPRAPARSPPPRSRWPPRRTRPAAPCRRSPPP